MTEILAQLVHEKEVLRNRLNMLEKDLTKARITIEEQERLIEKNHIVLQEQNRNMYLLQLRVEKLERSLSAYTSI